MVLTRFSETQAVHKTPVTTHTHIYQHYWSLLRARLSNLLRSCTRNARTHQLNTHTRARIHIKSLIWHTNSRRLFTVSLFLSLGCVSLSGNARHAARRHVRSRVRLPGQSTWVARASAGAVTRSSTHAPVYHHDSTLHCHNNLITVDSVQLHSIKP